MVVKVLDIPLSTQTAQLPATTPQWLRPYLAAAQRSGLLDGWQETVSMSEPITGAEAAVMLQNALDLTVSSKLLEAEQTAAKSEDIPTWAAASLAVMAENGIALSANAPLTRADAAQTLYLISLLAPDAPGMAIFRMQS